MRSQVHFGFTQNGYEQGQFEPIKILYLQAKVIANWPYAELLELEFYCGKTGFDFLHYLSFFLFTFSRECC